MQSNFQIEAAANFTMSRKVLVSGDVNGNFHALYKRVAAVNKANGPFDILLCVGSFFTSAGDDL